MRALVYHGERHIDFVEVAEPKPKAGQLLLKPLYVGICFTEFHAYLNKDWSFLPPGLTLGHEGSAVVVEIGPGTSGGWAVGDRVSVNPIYGCGDCLMCRGGYKQECLNSTDWFPTMCSDLFVAPEKSCFKIPDRIGDLEAAFIEPITFGTRAVRHSGVRIGDHCVVLGLDDYGIAALQWLRNAGAAKLVGVDPIAVRRDIAAKLGADAVLDPRTDGRRGDVGLTTSQLDRQANRRAAHPYPKILNEMPFGADIVFLSMEMYVPDSLQYLAEALKIVRFGGTIVILRGYYGKGGLPNFTSPEAWMKEVTIRHFGAVCGEEPWRGGRDRGDYALTIHEVGRGKLNAREPITKTVDWRSVLTRSDVDDVYNLYPREEAKIFFKFG